MKTKILYLLPGGLFNSGGMERVITLKANYLTEKLNYDVSIATTEQMGRPIFYPVSTQVHLYHLDVGIHVNFGKESYLEKCVSRFQKTREYKKVLENLLKKLRPDFTISTLGGLDIGFLNNLDDGSIKLGELHFPGNYRQLMARKLSNAFLPNLVARCRTQEFKNKCEKLSRLVVLTEEEKLSWKNQRNIEVIPNPLPFSSLSESSTTQQKKAIAVGRLAYEKGFDLLIEAWKNVFKKHPDWELNIYGKGDQRDALIRLIKDSGLEGVVKINDPSNDIQKLYIEHSMLILPSRYLEALPMVLIEAMACGLPLVAFDAPCGPKDVIIDGVNGFLVESGNKEKLAEKINDLIESDELRKSMGNAAQKASLNYSPDRIMERWHCLFEELKNGK
ncbi:MAG: glycosyltransferase family 4 protein [Candidatus Azobacteroides sp.]|nr:glycosyltransferase family 4 protein [Candidatus Azobacteroides sp.]